MTFPPGRYVLDGELVASSFDTLGQPIHPARSRVEHLAAETPATFVAFDLLAEDDEILLRLPFPVILRSIIVMTTYLQTGMFLRY